MLKNICTYEVKVTSFSQDGHVGYTEARLSELTYSKSIGKEVGNNEEAGLSKKNADTLENNNRIGTSTTHYS